MIIGYYNQLPSQLPTANITQVDLLMVHWPINCCPCAVPVRRGTMCARCFCAPQSANPAGCSAPPPTPGHGGRTLPEHDTNDRPSLRCQAPDLYREGMPHIYMGWWESTRFLLRGFTYSDISRCNDWFLKP